MHLGICMFATDYAIRTDELARAAEERGFESLFVPEHTHIPTSRRTPFPGGEPLPKEYSHTFDPFVSLMAAAAATKRLKVGTGICLIIERDTITTAKEVASLDVLSGGRFLFGIGAGWNADEMENHGTEYKTRYKRMREQVLAMKEIWTKDEAEFHGQFVNFDPIWSWPKPAQKPHPPVLLGGESGHTLQRVVDFCEGWFPRGRARDVILAGLKDLQGRPRGRARHEDDLGLGLRRQARGGDARDLRGRRHHPGHPSPALRRPRRDPAAARPVREADSLSRGARKRPGGLLSGRRASKSARAPSLVLDEGLQRAAAQRVAQLAQGLGLDLPDALAGHREAACPPPRACARPPRRCRSAAAGSPSPWATACSARAPPAGSGPG